MAIDWVKTFCLQIFETSCCGRNPKIDVYYQTSLNSQVASVNSSSENVLSLLILGEKAHIMHSWSCNSEYLLLTSLDNANVYVWGYRDTDWLITEHGRILMWFRSSKAVPMGLSRHTRQLLDVRELTSFQKLGSFWFWFSFYLSIQKISKVILM